MANRLLIQVESTSKASPMLILSMDKANYPSLLVPCSWANYTRCDILSMVFSVTMVTFRMTLHMNKWTNTIMDDGWVQPLAKTLPSLVNNLWWYLASDSKCNCTSIIFLRIYKEWQIILGQHLVVVTLHCSLQLVLNKTIIRTSGTKYHIKCSSRPINNLCRWMLFKHKSSFTLLLGYVALIILLA